MQTTIDLAIFVVIFALVMFGFYAFFKRSN